MAKEQWLKASGIIFGFSIAVASLGFIFMGVVAYLKTVDDGQWWYAATWVASVILSVFYLRRMYRLMNKWA